MVLPTFGEDSYLKAVLRQRPIPWLTSPNEPHAHGWPFHTVLPSGHQVFKHTRGHHTVTGAVGLMHFCTLDGSFSALDLYPFMWNIYSFSSFDWKDLSKYVTVEVPSWQPVSRIWLIDPFCLAGMFLKIWLPVFCFCFNFYYFMLISVLPVCELHMCLLFVEARRGHLILWK